RARGAECRRGAGALARGRAGRRRGHERGPGWDAAWAGPQTLVRSAVQDRPASDVLGRNRVTGGPEGGERRRGGGGDTRTVTARRHNQAGGGALSVRSGRSGPPGRRSGHFPGRSVSVW